MKVDGKNYRTVWMEGRKVFYIDQNRLPFKFSIRESYSCHDTCTAIRTMGVRGAGAIGAAAAYAMAQAALEAPDQGYEDYLSTARKEIESTRPTARNLFYAAQRVYTVAGISRGMAIEEANAIADEDARASLMIGQFGKQLIRDKSRIATHCNAGWLAFVDHGTALSPIYASARDGKEMFVYVDETRPRGQGARLTAWELEKEGIPHAIIPDNATAWYMSKGMIDLMIVGADRIAANGDVANKIGTLEKALSANAFGIPFYVAAPTSTFDGSCPSGTEMVIEERDPGEVLYQWGITRKGKLEEVRVASPDSGALNPAFDVTPARYITAIITEKGIIEANSRDIGGII